MNRSHRRFQRQLSRIGSLAPWLGTLLGAVSTPGRRWLRPFLAAALIAGGLLGFLPIVGFWMLPLGLLLLAADLPALRAPIGNLVVRARALLRRWRPRR
ncbi:MAG: hypothetical protein Kow0013_01950 [Pararhodobacter sp.]